MPKLGGKDISRSTDRHTYEIQSHHPSKTRVSLPFMLALFSFCSSQSHDIEEPRTYKFITKQTSAFKYTQNQLV